MKKGTNGLYTFKDNIRSCFGFAKYFSSRMSNNISVMECYIKMMNCDHKNIEQERQTNRSLQKFMENDHLLHYKNINLYFIS